MKLFWTKHVDIIAVLRGTVEALLAKRKIDYYLMKGKGSFLVNAASGFVLYEPSQPTDSKVIVAPNSVSLQNKGRIPIRRSILHRELSESMEESRKAMKKEFHNRCNEEAAFQKAVSKSLEEKAMEKAEEEQLLGQAVDLSLLEKQKEIDEEEKLDAAIEISKRESIVNTMDEDEQMRDLLALSKAEFDQQRDPDAYLQHVIKLSKKERNEFDEKSRIPEECDEELLKVLELSAVDF
jgi:hypothetical protein